MTIAELDGDGALVSIGGPIFRKPGISRAEFSLAWTEHAQVVIPWFLEFGIVEYVQIHLPNPGQGKEAAVPKKTEEEEEEDEEEPTAAPDGASAAAAAAAAERALQGADGVALVRCRSVPSVDGVTRPFGDGLTHPYVEKVIAADERRFLHEESGVSAVKREPPAFEVPDLEVDEWRRMALRAGGVEHVKIKNAKDAIDGAWWDEWEKLELGIPN